MRQSLPLHRIHRWSWLFAFPVLIGVVACAPSVEMEKQGLVYCSEGTPEGFNPQLATSGTTFDASAYMLYDRLVMRDERTGELSPALASDWKVDKFGTRYTFHLRSGVSWHHTEHFRPTRTLNSADVAFSFNRQLQPHHPFHHVANSDYPYFHSSGLADILAAVTAIDSDTVQFDLKHSSSQFLTILSMEFASILSEEYAQQLLTLGTPEKIDNEPVGTGPFQLLRYENRELIRYSAHADYYRGAPTLKQIVFVITPDPSLRLSRLRAGECDVMAQPSPAHLPLIKKNQTLDLITQPGFNVAYWAFNVRKPPFDDVRVREALSLAIDRDAIIDAVYFNAAQQAKGPLPPSIEGYAKRLTPYDYDPVRAKKLLKAAGVSEPFSLDIWAMPVSRPYNPNAHKMAEIIQADLRRIGIDAKIVSYEWQEFLRRIRNGEHSTALMGWSADLNDADNFFTPLLSCAGITAGTNRSFWCNENFDQLLQLAKSTDDAMRREMALHEAQFLFRQHHPWAAIAHASQYLAIRHTVKNVRLSQSGTLSFYQAEKQP